MLREAEPQADDVDRQGKFRLERGQYEAQLAERRYQAMDPDHRVVARTLEREWNDKRLAVERVEREDREVRRRDKIDLAEDDRARLRSVAQDLPAVWRATTTTNAERKNRRRLVGREVTVNPIDGPERMTRVQVLGPTGAVSDFTVPRQDTSTAQATAEPARSLIRELSLNPKKDDRAIAGELNRQGLRPGPDRAGDLGAVRRVRCGAGIVRASPKARRPPAQGSDGLSSVHALAARAGVKPNAIRSWARTGALQPAVAHGGPGPGRPHWFKLDAETIDRRGSLAAQYAQRRLPRSPHHRPPGRRRSEDPLGRRVEDEPVHGTNPASPRPPKYGGTRSQSMRTAGRLQ